MTSLASELPAPVETTVVPPTVKLKFSNQIHKLVEIFVSGIQYSFVSKENDQVHQWVYCRDSLTDVMWATYNKSSVNIYGFMYNPGKEGGVDLENTRLAIGNKNDPLFSDRILGILDVLNQVEARLDLRLTVAQKVTNPGDYKSGLFVLVGSKRWEESPPMLSFMTLLIRVGCSHKVGTPFMETMDKLIKGELPEYQHYDMEYCAKAKDLINNILKIGYRPYFFKDPKKNYPSKVALPAFHHFSGIVAMAAKESDQIVQHWTRKDLKNKPSIEERRAAKLVEEAKVNNGEMV